MGRLTLYNIIESSTNVVKILVSSHNDADLVSQLKDFPNISINVNDDGYDFQGFIRVRLTEQSGNGRSCLDECLWN